MSKTVSCRLSSDTHEKLLDKCNEKGMTVNDFVKVLVQSALDGTHKLACDSTSNRLDSTKKLLKDMSITEIETELGFKQHDESNIDRSNFDTWIRDLNKSKKLISDKHLKSLGLEVE